MKDMMKYKNYYGSVHYDPDEIIFYGKLEFVKALVSYESETAIGIKKAFEQAVDDYLKFCRKEKIAPEKPFKGSFNIRTGHKLHELVALAAERNNMSLNKFICLVLEKECNLGLQTASA
jgi:predicted HicB family RNase H-like nuclease